MTDIVRKQVADDIEAPVPAAVASAAPPPSAAAITLTHEDLNRLHRHFINLTCHYSNPSVPTQNGGKPRVFNCSAFIVELKGVWVAITAGHVFGDLRKAVATGLVLFNWHIDDSMLDEHQHPPFQISLDLEKDVMDFDVDGMDYGAYVVDPMAQRALAKRGICPIEEAYWDANDFELFPFWTLVGSPLQLATLQYDGPSIKNHVTVHLIPLFDRPVGLRETKYQRLYAKVDFDSVEGIDGSFDIGGMSGGPIFGTASYPQGDEYDYRLIGIQSAWDKQGNVAICAAQPFLRALAGLVRQGGRRA